jgi:uncharacterized membrane protein
LDLIVLPILVPILLALPGAYLFRLYAKTNPRIDLSFARSFRIVLLGFIGCAVFGVIFNPAGTTNGHAFDPFFFSLIAFTSGTIGVQAFIFFLMTKSVDDERIKFKYAFIVSTMLFVPGLMSTIAVLLALDAI